MSHLLTKTDKKRTDKQNKALWKLFELMAESLNDSGYDMRKTLKPEIDIPWNKNTICEYIWKPIMKAQKLKNSTTELTTKDINDIYEVVNRFLGEKLGIHVPFPSYEEILYQQEHGKKENNY